MRADLAVDDANVTARHHLGGEVSILTRLRADRRTSISTAVVLAFSGGVAVAAMLYDGEATASVDLDDSGVWVTKESSGLVGRFNTEAKALDGTLLAAARRSTCSSRPGTSSSPTAATAR